MLPGELGINLSNYVSVDVIDKFIPTINLPTFGTITRVFEVDTTFVVDFDVDFDIEFTYDYYDPITNTTIQKTETVNYKETLSSDPIEFKKGFEFTIDIDEIIELDKIFDQDKWLAKVKAKLQNQLDSYIYFTHGDGEYTELVLEEYGLKYVFDIADDAGGAINLPANSSRVTAPNGVADVSKTPIVRVTILTEDNKPFEEAFIKINWTN